MGQKPMEKYANLCPAVMSQTTAKPQLICTIKRFYKTIQLLCRITEAIDITGKYFKL